MNYYDTKVLELCLGCPVVVELVDDSLYVGYFQQGCLNGTYVVLGLNLEQITLRRKDIKRIVPISNLIVYPKSYNKVVNPRSPYERMDLIEFSALVNKAGYQII